MKTFTLFFFLFVTVLLAGCSVKSPIPEPSSELTQQENINSVGDAEQVTDDLQELDTSDAALDTSDLDTLEDDLAIDF